jgi:hypothetical protein
MSLEAGFAAPGPVRPVPANGQQITTLIIKMSAIRGKGLPTDLLPGAYTVIHPFGTINFTADATGSVPAFTVVDGGGVGAFGALLPATNTLIGPFLVWDAGIPITDPVTGNMYIGDPRVDHAVIGGKNNFVKITGPGVNVTSNLFRVAGKLIALAASPASLTFPIQNGLVPSAPQNVTVTNVTGAALTPGAITSTNPNFTIPVNGCTGVSIPASGTCAFQVVFQGTAPDGVKTATVSVAAPAGNPAGVVAVSGSLDTTAPTVISTIPAASGTMPSNSSISATFSEAVTNINNTTFTLAGPSGAIAGNVVFNAASKTATFTPAVPLDTPANFTATITGGAGGVADLAGNLLAANFTLAFATAAPDSVAPAVVSIDPADQTAEVSPAKVITVTFSEPMDPSTVNSTTFSLSGGITGIVVYDPSTKTATFTPSASLAKGALYTVSVSTGAKDLAQNPLAAAFSAKFVTDAGPNAPQLVSPEIDAAVTGTSVDFQWTKSADPDNDAITYHLYYCTNQLMFGCTPVNVPAAPSLHDTLSGLGGYGAGMLLAGFFIAGGVKSRKKLFFLFAVLLISGMAVTACGSKSSSEGGTPAPNANLMTKNVTGLSPGTTYFWKVVADDGNGALTDSETRSFTTL